MTRTVLAQLAKALPQLILALALLAVAAVLGDRHTITGPEAYAVLLAVLGAAGLAAGITLGTPTVSNIAVVPHLVVVLAALGMVMALGIVNVFSDAQVFGVIGLFIGTGALATGSAGAGVTPAQTPAQMMAQAQSLIDAARATTGAPPPPH